MPVSIPSYTETVSGSKTCDAPRGTHAGQNRPAGVGKGVGDGGEAGRGFHRSVISQEPPHPTRGPGVNSL